MYSCQHQQLLKLDVCDIKVKSVCVVSDLLLPAGSAVSSCIAGDNHDAYLWGFGDSSQLGKGTSFPASCHCSAQRVAGNAIQPIGSEAVGV